MLAELFLDASDACRESSPLTRALLVSAADDLAGGGVTARIMAGAECDRAASAPARRFASAVHRLVLEGRAPALAGHYATVGGRLDAGAFWADALPVLEEHADDLHTVIASAAVPTDEPGRSSPLFGGLQTATHLAADAAGRRTGFPVRLLEVGASGGLNLRPHRVAYRVDDDLLGDRHSPFTLDAGWCGRPDADVTRNLRLVRRAGCDANPVDVSTVDGRLSLSAAVPGDRADHYERLQAAFALALLDPVPVSRAAGPEWLAEQLARPERDVLTVVWHSLVWHHVSPADRAMGREVLAGAAARATPMAPLALLVYEPRRSGEHYELLLKLWPAGVSLRLGTGAPHGVPFTWDVRAWD
ncbi:DUF2332 domain-containing protein [Saccharothrix violaceirubra]|uniref:DUF2332 domain-containing protein n=1 Tax=Saccharothrix violaceirubra TaxID=413306 RepID=A0A7W7WYD2_9PSEU|nr:DUF2332 domain-containing protein [Saccharothrix violaceirubra]MBB4968315.1 hypothetical protein [Saccharothrix violaceirubra]